MLAVLLATVAWADCTEAVPIEQFREELAGAWEHAAEERSVQFRASMAELQAAIGCLKEPITPLDAAGFHRNRALISLEAGDPHAASSAAGAALRLAPDEAATWAEASAPFATLLAEATPAGALQEFSVSLATSVWVDGEVKTGRTLGQPAVIQVFGPDGNPVGGAWVDSRSPLPEWLTFPRVSCPEVVAVDNLVEAVDEADQAFARLDSETFGVALRTVAVGLPCVDGEIASSQAAAIHRLEGMRLFTLGAELGALRSFQESRLLDPTYLPSQHIMQPESTLEFLWVTAGSTAPPPWLPMAAPPQLHMRVDGIPAAERPATLPTIVQATTASGTVLWTRYVPAMAALPDLSAYVSVAEREAAEQLPPALRVYHEAERVRQRHLRRIGLSVSGAGLIIVGGLLYNANATLLADFHDPETPPDELVFLRGAVNTTATASSVFLLAGTGMVTVAFVLR